MDFPEFREKWENEWSRTESEAVRGFLISVMEYLEDPEEGARMVSLTMPEQYTRQDGTPGRDAFLEYFARNDGISARSYLGGTPENGYSYSYDHPIELLANSSRGEDESKVFIQSGGKDLPSPVHLRRNDAGEWKLVNVSSLATGVKKPDKGDF